MEILVILVDMVQDLVLHNQQNMVEVVQVVMLAMAAPEGLHLAADQQEQAAQVVEVQEQIQPILPPKLVAVVV